VGRKRYKPEDIDPAVLPLVDVLNELEHIETEVSCDGHDDTRWSSRTPFVTFFVRCCLSEDGDPVFPGGALRQLGALSWILRRTFRDGFFPIEDEAHRQEEPLARVLVRGEPPGADHEETPRWWTPVSFVLEVQDKSAIPCVLETLRANWADLRDRRGALAYDREEEDER
jgi:hypothetical protein